MKMNHDLKALAPQNAEYQAMGNLSKGCITTECSKIVLGLPS